MCAMRVTTTLASWSRLAGIGRASGQQLAGNAARRAVRVRAALLSALRDCAPNAGWWAWQSCQHRRLVWVCCLQSTNVLTAPNA